MVIAERLRTLREQKGLSQGDIEKRSGLLRCYLSRVEDGHTVPSVETLEKLAKALEVPLYQFFYEGRQPPKAVKLPKGNGGDTAAWGNFGEDAKTLARFRAVLARMNARNLKILMSLAQRMARIRRKSA